MYRAFRKVWIIKCFTASKEKGKQKAEQICFELRLDTKQQSRAKQQELQRRSSHPDSSRSPGQARQQAGLSLKSAGGKKKKKKREERGELKDEEPNFSPDSTNATPLTSMGVTENRAKAAQQTRRESLKTNRTLQMGEGRIMGILGGDPGHPIPWENLSQTWTAAYHTEKFCSGSPRITSRNTARGSGQGLCRLKLLVPKEQYVRAQEAAGGCWTEGCSLKLH